MTDSTEFFIYRDDSCVTETEYENFKLSFNASLLLKQPLISVVNGLKASKSDLINNFKIFDQDIADLKEHAIDFNESITKSKNSIQQSFYQQESSLNSSIEELEQKIQQIIDDSEHQQDKMKKMLRHCLEEKLQCEPTVLNSIFICKNLSELKELFNSDEEFYNLTNEKAKYYNKVDPCAAFKAAAKIAAVKGVDPTLTEQSRAKKIKDNLSKVKPCIDAINQQMKGFIDSNQFDPNQYNEISEQLQQWNKDVKKLVSVDKKREISAKKKEVKINEAAKIPAKERSEPSLDQAITANLIMPR